MIALKHISSQIEASYIGLIEYDKACSIQQNLWRLAKEKDQLSILGLEHPAVVTLGRRMEASTYNIADENIPVVQSTRGGLATIHSEGQLVIYPIVNLRKAGIGVKDFVLLLLKTTQTVFTSYGLETHIDDRQIGLYSLNGKIAFCGLEIKEGVSRHGISINIANDLRLFSNIISCGIENLQTDRLINHNADVTPRDFFNKWSVEFNKNFLS